MDGNDGTQGQGPNTPQKDGVHGVESKTLHGAEGFSGSTAIAEFTPNIAKVAAAANTALVRQTNPMAPSVGLT
jgi:hypothetical protein